MQRRLTATIALVLVLIVAGCGKDDTSDTTAKTAATVTQPSAAESAGNEVGTPTGGAKRSGSKRSGSKRSGSKGSASKTSSGSKPSASKTSGSRRSGSKSSGSKTSSSSKPSASKTPAASDGGLPSAGGATASAGGDAADARLAVVAVVRRYQKDFIEGDGKDACSLLTADGKKQMTAGGRGRTCAESVARVLDQSRASDIRLIRRTRAGIHVDDVTIRGDIATVDIGKGQRLRLGRQDGSWLVSDPSP
jgi:hypothetical protein